jgi:hypothetical protein
VRHRRGIASGATPFDGSVEKVAKRGAKLLREPKNENTEAISESGRIGAKIA